MEFLEQMVALARDLKSKGQIRAMYCCDTRLHRIEIQRSARVQLIGGGGTAWTVEHNSELLQDMKIESGLEVFYCTDGFVDGLSEAQRDQRVNLHVVNIPDLMTGLDSSKEAV